MLNVMKSEWIKLRTTKAIWWTSGLILFFSIGMAILMGSMTGLTLSMDNVKKDPEMYAQTAASLNPSLGMSGYTIFGLMIVLIQGVMIVTTEYGSGTSKSTLLGVPTRWQVPVAKFVVYGAIAAVLSFVSLLVGVLALHWSASWKITDSEILKQAAFGSGDMWTMVGRNVLYTVLAVALSIGVGYLIRHTAGAIASLLLWKLVIEGALVGMIPKVKDWLPPYMPFQNMTSAAQMQKVADAPWDQTGSMLYFAAWCAVLFVLGLVMLKRRDA